VEEDAVSDTESWSHTTPEIVPYTSFEMCRPRGHGNIYRIVLRGKRYDAEKNFKVIGSFAELEAAQRCVEASAARRRKRKG
jgi:hypothetical protein